MLHVDMLMVPRETVIFKTTSVTRTIHGTGSIFYELRKLQTRVQDGYRKVAQEKLGAKARSRGSGP
jgi:hypothetical protein